MSCAKFNIGQVVYHQKQGYRGVIIDVDPCFSPSLHNDPIALKRNIANHEAWYRILVDESAHTSYVRESLLTPDTHPEPVDNPEINYYLEKEKNGRYKTTVLLN